MSVPQARIDIGIFAKLVGRYPDKDVLLFQVSRPFLDEIINSEAGAWSDPVQFRFRRDAGALVDMEMRRIVA